MIAFFYAKIDFIALVASALSAVGAFVVTSTMAGYPLGVHPARRLLSSPKFSLASLLLQHAYDVSRNEPLFTHRGCAIDSNYRSSGSFVSFLPRILVHHPRDIEFILSSDDFTKPSAINVLKPLLGEGLVTQLDEVMHAKHRRIASPAFGPSSLSRIANFTVRDHSIKLVDVISREIAKSGQQSIVAPLETFFTLTTLNIIAEAAFTAQDDINNITDHIVYLMDNTPFSILNFVPILRSIPHLNHFRQQKSLKELTKFVNDLQQRKREEGPQSSRNLIDHLLFTGELSAEHIRDHSLTFIFAGHETTSNSLTWVTALLATHPQVEAKLFEELSCLITMDTCPDVESIKQCSYLHNVIREGLRLYPTVPVILREPKKDVVLPFSKAVVPKGMAMSISFWNLHRFEGTFGSDADKFIPERWEDPEVERKAVDFGFLPFSAGKRNCIGKDFALNEIFLLLAVVVRNFQLSAVEGEPWPRRKIVVTLKPSKPFKMRIERRVL